MNDALTPWPAPDRPSKEAGGSFDSLQTYAGETRNLLFISHRFPYPLTKGEKIRGYKLITHFAKTYRVYLGCIVDDPADWQHVDHLRTICTDVAAFGINRRWQKVKALAQIRPGRPLMPDYYFHPGLQRWVNHTLAHAHMDIVYIYSAAMAPYALHLQRHGKVLDMQDIDSEKWALYAQETPWPMRSIWAREGRTLRSYERQAAAGCDATFFVTEQETKRFCELAPESAEKSTWIEMGVDLESFAPGRNLETPYKDPGPHLVFTGSMDYRPNAEAAIWFAREALPLLRTDWPGAQFHVVGNRPRRDVLALKKRPGVHVTGGVPDIRPYVAHADVSVSPLRMARGVQNKVLEAMALGKPVVASPQAFEGIRAVAGRDLLVADGLQATVSAVHAILTGKHPGLGAAARTAMERGYSWDKIFQKLDRWLEASLKGRVPA